MFERERERERERQRGRHTVYELTQGLYKVVRKEKRCGEKRGGKMRDGMDGRERGQTKKIERDTK